jgi:hypothetical protein
MSKYTSNLFESLKETLSTKTNTDSSFKDFLKCEPDKTYVVRLLPNVEDGSKTRFHYWQHIFDSCVNGKKISILCPNTYGEKCPIDEYRSKVWASKNEKLIEQSKPLRKTEKWLYNVFVISDPTNPDNNGQVKILNAGVQLQKIIQSAIDGDDSQEFGYRIFDLSENGCNLRIKVEKNEGGYPSYVSSRFMSPSKVEGMDDADEVYNSVKSLDNIFQRKSYTEIKNLMDVHFFGKDETEVKPNQDSSYEDEEPVNTFKSDADSEVKISSSESDDDDEKRMQDILKDL